MSNVKILNARSLELGKTAKELGKEIHLHCLALMQHVQANSGDISVCKVFLDALSPTDKAGKNASIVRSEAVKKWLQDFAFLSFEKNEKGRVVAKLAAKKFKEAKQDNFAAHNKAARVLTWNKYTPEPAAVKAFDVDTAIDNALKAIEKSIDEARLGTGRFERQTPEVRAANKLESARLDAIRAAAKAVA